MLNFFSSFRIFFSVSVWLLILLLPLGGWAEDLCKDVKNLSDIKVLEELYFKRPIEFSENEISAKVDDCWRCKIEESETCGPEYGYAKDFGKSLADIAIKQQNTPNKLVKLLYFIHTVLRELNEDKPKSYTAVVGIYNSFIERLKSEPGFTILKKNQLEKIEKITLEPSSKPSLEASKTIDNFSKYVINPIMKNIPNRDCVKIEEIVDIANLKKRIFGNSDFSLKDDEVNKDEIQLEKCWTDEIGCGEIGEKACAEKLGGLLAKITRENQADNQKLQKAVKAVDVTFQTFFDRKYYPSCVAAYNAFSLKMASFEDLKGPLFNIGPLSKINKTTMPRQEANDAVKAFHEKFKELLTPTSKPIPKMENQNNVNSIEPEAGQQDISNSSEPGIIPDIDQRDKSNPPKIRTEQPTKPSPEHHSLKLIYILLAIISLFVLFIFFSLLIEKRKAGLLVKKQLRYFKDKSLELERNTKNNMEKLIDENKEIKKAIYIVNRRYENILKIESEKQTNGQNGHPNSPKRRENMNYVDGKKNMPNNGNSGSPERIVKSPIADDIHEKLTKRIIALENDFRENTVSINELQKAINDLNSKNQKHPESSPEKALLKIERELFKRKKENIESNDALISKKQEVLFNEDFFDNAIEELPKLIIDPALKARHQGLTQNLKAYSRSFRELNQILKYNTEQFPTEIDEIVQLRLWTPFLDRLEDENHLKSLLEFDVKKWVEQKFIIFADAFLIEYQKARSEGRSGDLQKAYDKSISILKKADIEPISVIPKKDRLNKELHILRARATDKSIADEVIVSVVKTGFKQGGQILNKAEVIVNKID